MPDILLVHPAPIRSVPARSRTERTVYERVQTPAHVREVPPAEMRRIGTLTNVYDGRSATVHEHEGEAWTPFMGPGGALPVRAENLLAFLRGEAVAIGDRGMPAPLEWTPLHAWKGGTPRLPSRGDEPADAPCGRIVEDGRDRARSEAAAWVLRDLRLSDGRAWRRLRGPMAHPVTVTDISGARMPEFYQVALDPMAYASETGLLDAVVRADAIDGHAAFLREMGNGAFKSRQVLRGLDLPLASLPGSNRDDLDIACNYGLTHVVRRVGITLTGVGAVVEDRPAVDAALARLSGHAMRAVVSGVRPEEYGEVLQGVDDLIRTVLARIPEDAKGAGILRRQRGWLERDILPRATAPTAEADEGALMGLTR